MPPHHNFLRVFNTMLLLLLVACLVFTIGHCYSIDREGKSVALIERRRDFIRSSIIGATSSLLPWHTSLPYTIRANAEEISYQRITSTKKAAEYIHKYCNSDFLSSVINSRYNFLYRGLSPDESEAVTYNGVAAAIIIKEEPHDLLRPDTYGSADAAAYFQSLEDEMDAIGISIKPSNSHLGTTCPKDAALWGRAASYWPLGEKGVEFAWLEDGGLFWPINEKDLKTKKRRIVSPSTNTGRKGELQLSNALQGDSWEIMFRADNGFVAVPAELDDELRAYLMKMQ